MICFIFLNFSSYSGSPSTLGILINVSHSLTYSVPSSPLGNIACLWCLSAAVLPNLFSLCSWSCYKFSGVMVFDGLFGDNFLESWTTAGMIWSGVTKSSDGTERTKDPLFTMGIGFISFLGIKAPLSYLLNLFICKCSKLSYGINLCIF